MSVEKAPFPYAAAIVGGAVVAAIVAIAIIDPATFSPRSKPVNINELTTPSKKDPPVQAPEVTPEPAKKKEYPPNYNFALAVHGASAEGGKDAARLIDGNATRYSAGSGFATARLDSNPPQAFVVRLQDPVFLRCIRFLLWNISKERFYRYKLEVCSEDSNWFTIQDKSSAEECRGWQNIQFDARVVKLIRLTGTFNSDNSFFQVVELEAYDDPPPLSETPPPPADDSKKRPQDMEF
jgi:hypothetical protein